MPNIVLPILTAIARRASAKFAHKTRHPDTVQAQFLHSLLQAHHSTHLGQQLGLSQIKTIDQFRDRVPILPYSSYEPYLERIANGEDNVLTSAPVVYITLTSGSTGKKKLIPTTPQSQAIVRQASLVSLGFLSKALQARGTKLGKLVVTNSTQSWGRTPNGIEFGPASAGVLRLDKRLYEQLFAHPYPTVCIADSSTRHYVTLLFALRDPLMRGFIANFPMLILRTCNYLEQYAEDLITDIDKGTLAAWLDIEPQLRSQLERCLSANPHRARQLRDILDKHGCLTPKLAWPDLSVVATARGGTSDFYFQRFGSYFGDTPVFGVVFSSAEGIFSIYPDVNTDGSVLAIDSGFFEFIPQQQWHCEQPKTLLASEVQPGQLYRILLTSYSGFYRYDIGDVIEVVGFYEKTPLIVFRYRQGGQISATTEKTNEAHVTKVMQALQHEFNLALEDFCIALSENEFPARYLVNIELAPGYKLEDSQAFLSSFDRKLQQANTHYEISRKGDIPPPRLRILSPGSFAIVRQRQVERGVPDSHLKFPHITEDRQLLANLSVLQDVDLSE